MISQKFHNNIELPPTSDEKIPQYFIVRVEQQLAELYLSPQPHFWYLPLQDFSLPETHFLLTET